MNKQELATKIWTSANKMRSKIEANEYKDYILGFMFYKFLSEKEVRYLYDSIGCTSEEDVKQLIDLGDNYTSSYAETIKKDLGYFIPYKYLFSTWISKGNDFVIGDVTDALAAFEDSYEKDYVHLFKGIFETLRNGINKLGTTTQGKTKAARDLINIIKLIPMNGEQDYDVLGFIYEDLLKNFASNAGKKAGEFYTPHEVSMLMSQIVSEHLKDQEKIQIMDTTSGSGSLLLNIGKAASKYVDKNNITYFAQELKQNTYNLTRMNLIMRGIEPSNIKTKNADTLADDWPLDDEPLYVHAVVSNPPYSQEWDPEGKEMDRKYRDYGLAPKGKADYAFLLHDLYHTRPEGIMTIVLPHGVLFRGASEGEIRKNLIEKNQIDTIIGLPANIFYGTGIPTIIMVLKPQRSDIDDVLIIDASKGFAKEGKQNKLRESDIRKIADTVKYRREIDKFSRRVSRAEIRENDYNLNIPRYVDSSDPAETFDVFASMNGGIPKSELAALDAYWKVMPNLKQELFEDINSTHVKLKVESPAEVIKEHADSAAFISGCNESFDGFDTLMYSTLIEKLYQDGSDSIEVVKVEDKLSETLLNMLSDVELVNPYEVYQGFADVWNGISKDLETIAAEKDKSVSEIINSYVPNMVQKKKGSEDIEVQEGWRGKIIPFNLITETLLKPQADVLKQEIARKESAESQVKEIFEGLTEEEKEDYSSLINAKGDDFSSADLNKFAKQCLKGHTKEDYDEESMEYRAIEVFELKDEIKKLKDEIKVCATDLDEMTLATIQNLTEDQQKELLRMSWIIPVVESFETICQGIITHLANEVDALAKKYASTLSDIESEIRQVESELIGLLDQLVGSEADMQGIEELKRILGGE